MASRYSKIQSTVWNSRKFKAAKNYRFEYLYLLTCPHNNSSGFFRLPEGYAITDLQCSSEHYRKALAKLVEVGLISIDGDTILIHQFLRWNSIMNPKHAKGTCNEIVDFLNSPLYPIFHREVGKYCRSYIGHFPAPGNGANKVLVQYQDGIITETEKETDRDLETKERAVTTNDVSFEIESLVDRDCIQTAANVDLIKDWINYFDDGGASEIVSKLITDFGYPLVYECIHEVGDKPKHEHPNVPAAYIRKMCANREAV